MAVMLLCVVLPLLTTSRAPVLHSAVVAVMVEFWWNIREEHSAGDGQELFPLGEDVVEVDALYANSTQDSVTHLDQVAEGEWRAGIDGRVDLGDDLPFLHVVHLDGAAVVGHNSSGDQSWFSTRLRSTWVGCGWSWSWIWR